jgi:nicotinate-nucleotide pyrophosphorylase (carboxylating)
VFNRVPVSTNASASFVAKADGVIAGLYVATVVFERVDTAVEMAWMVNDGDVVRAGQVLGVATGPAHAILIGERVALNYMQRMSGIATQTASMVKEIGCCTKTRLLDTRKTVPGLRLLDKWAVKIGGGENHRIGLYDMMMIKDNHIAAAGGLKRAVHAAEEYMRAKGIQRPLEVETRTMEEVNQVIDVIDSAGESSMVTRIMLDNMAVRNEDGSVDVSLLEEALRVIGDRRVETEASGNVTLATIRHIAKTGVDFISTVSITHSVTALDISLLIQTT